MEVTAVGAGPAPRRCTRGAAIPPPVAEGSAHESEHAKIYYGLHSHLAYDAGGAG